MNFGALILLIFGLLNHASMFRLHKLFQFIDGFRSEHNFLGCLHVGNDYAVFLKTPNPHDKFLEYELYEAKNVPDITSYKPRLLAISKVPIDYVKEQLKIFRTELYKARYVDDNVVPGTQVKTMREWQIDRALNGTNGIFLRNNIPLLRTVI